MVSIICSMHRGSKKVLFSLPFVCFCCRKIYGLAGLSFLGSTPGYTCALCALRTLAWPMVIHRCAEAGRR